MIKRYAKIVKKAKKFSKARRVILITIFIVFVLIIMFGALYFFLIKDLPSPAGLKNSTGSLSTRIYDRHGVLLYTIYADRNQTFQPLSKIPKNIQLATIAIEDKDFYHHGAVDLRGIVRAAYSIIFHKQLQGGSTLTQQLVKTSLLTPERTVIRKIKEVILAFATEALYPKDKILEMYLNQVPYGGTSYGIEAASLGYFGKQVKDLSLAEDAFLAGLPEAPSTFSPLGSHPELGKKRQEEILQKMYEQNYISRDERDKALAQTLHFQKISNPIKAPHFVFYVKDILSKKYGQQAVEQGGLKVTTSLDLKTQEFTQATVASQVAQLSDTHVGNGAALVTVPATGEILAMAGGKDYFGNPEPTGCNPGSNCIFEPNVNVTIAHRQPGSSIKPINYAVGLTKGYSAATPFIDSAICFPNPPQAPYCPRNYDGRFHGVVSMRQALGNSFNIPAVEMLKLNGLESVIDKAKEMGLTTLEDPSQYGLSFTLGGPVVTMVDMSTAFGVFANQGYRVDSHPILKVVDRDGKVLEEYKPPASPIFGRKVLSSDVTFIISDILADNNARLQEFGANSSLKVEGKHVSVKTGTTNDFHDNWTIGYTPSILVTTWVGNNDNSPMSGIVSGITGAAPIWNILMTHMLEGKKSEIPQKPPNVYAKYPCNSTGTVSSNNLPCSSHFEYFIRGTENKNPMTTRREKVFVDKTTGEQAPPGKTDNVEERDEDVMVDVVGNKYCISCTHPAPTLVPAH
ncbi:MAG TPA: transglycosylase domain-containing protein [Candidatus Saccharimonadales bacterium]|nr:transglycosylase domain-containing protein [Candidatus Saccharimonadales bacterium]